MSEPQKINITAEPQANPSRCLFRVDRNLYVGTLFTSDPEYAKKWIPLAGTLFDADPGIKSVRISHGEIMIGTKPSPQDWRPLARAIGGAIRNHLQEGKDVALEGAKQNLTGTDSVRHQVQEVIDQELNPALAAHGGFVEILHNDGMDFYLNMGGGCQGCGAAAATMRQGIEVAIREKVPEVANIYDGTDHAAGENPYM